MVFASSVVCASLVSGNLFLEHANKFVGPRPSVEREFSQSKPAQKRTTLHDSDSTTVEILSSHFS